MLGWGINIYKKNEPENSNWKKCIAHWETGLYGDGWIRKNCKKIEFNSGYPIKYITNGKFIKKMLKDGPVKYTSGATIIHEDEEFVEQKGETGWIGNPRINFTELEMLDDKEPIIIDTWDLS